MAKAIGPFPTSSANIAINLIYEWMGESRINRCYDDYMAIAARFSRIEACVARVNQRLEELDRSGFAKRHEICHFRPGDKHIRYAPYPARQGTFVTLIWESAAREERRTRRDISPISVAEPSAF
jgi:hypothetical protein